MKSILIPFLDAEIGAQLIETLGSAEFGSLLLQHARSLSRVDELFGYIVVDGEEPMPVVSHSRLVGVERRVESYLQRFFRHDPALRTVSRSAKGKSFVQRIGLTSIIPSDYRRDCFSKPGFTEKLSFGWRGDGYLAVISFYRSGEPDDDAAQHLASLANLALAIIVRHHAPLNRDGLIATLERRIRRSFPKLTGRERQICARTIAGHTAQTISSEFGLSMGTILTYRRRAYLKQSINRAADLLPQLVD